ncbi:hypothetical protein DITRI_Ditri20bG0087500 [Diplodiscus trichospermus]
MGAPTTSNATTTTTHPSTPSPSPSLLNMDAPSNKKSQPYIASPYSWLTADEEVDASPAAPAEASDEKMDPSAATTSNAATTTTTTHPLFISPYPWWTLEEKMDASAATTSNAATTTTTTHPLFISPYPWWTLEEKMDASAAAPSLTSDEKMVAHAATTSNTATTTATHLLSTSPELLQQILITHTTTQTHQVDLRRLVELIGSIFKDAAPASEALRSPS